MGHVNNNIYPVNARRLTSADLIPIFGSFIEDDRENQKELVYAINSGRAEYNYNASTYTDHKGIDIAFVVSDSSENKIFHYNDENKKWHDERGGSGDSNAQNTQDEINGYRYNGWNSLKYRGGGNFATSSEYPGDIRMSIQRTANDTSILLFPELDVSTYNRKATVGINDWRKKYGTKANEIKNYINNLTSINNTTSETIADMIQTNLLNDIDSDANTNRYDIIHTLNNILTSFDDSGETQTTLHTLTDIEFDGTSEKLQLLDIGLWQIPQWQIDITFKYLQQNKDFATVLTCMDESGSPWQGFAIRSSRTKMTFILNGNTKLINEVGVPIAIGDIVTYKMIRDNNKFKVTLPNGQVLEATLPNMTYTGPLALGSSYNNTTKTWLERNFKGTIISLKISESAAAEDIKGAYCKYVDNIFTSLQDELLTPINASMLRPDYEFDADILPDTNFRCINGIYSYRKFYSYQYNNWYYQHVNYWYRPWYWSWNYYWWWNHRWWHSFAWFWHSWWWNYWYYPYYYHLYSTSNTNVGETITMCNVFKYNNYYPNEYIPIDPQKYIENNNIGNNSSENNAKFRKYVEYLTSTYKSNIYKINSYITTVNKMVDKIVAICDYIIYDNDNTIVQGADINYNIIYDKYQRIDLDDNNYALSDTNLKNGNGEFEDLLKEDIGFLKANVSLTEEQAWLYNQKFNPNPNKKEGDKLSTSEANSYNNTLPNIYQSDDTYEKPISEFSIVNGIDITRIKYKLPNSNNYNYINKARKHFPIKPIYLLICPKTQNNTNKIIKYKVNLYQYGNINANSILTFIMYQMPKLITVKFTFNCGGYNLRKDTFGILGNVNNSSPSNPANVNIITNAEFDEAAARDYHMSDKMHRILSEEHIVDNTYAQNNLNTPYKYGVRRFYNGASTIESVVNQEYDKYKERKTIGINNWPTYETGELPILALNDQDHIVVFLSTLAYDTGQDDYNNFFNSSAYVTFQLYTEDYSSYVTVTMSGHKTLFKGNNIYNASNNNSNLHWGSNITGIDFKAYPDVKSGGTYRNNNANVMFSHLYGYRIYLKHWYTLQQTSTQEIAVNGKRLKVTFVWTVLPVTGNKPDGSPFWTSGTP